ncbi:hypothetical protein ACIQUQ_11535 [Streptomyces sp. NPDC101118]|uniref:hypothetical protein n=1 Tax=Streptomyces sp. NPDC101118 TaxID=3366109 RepID=UPI0038230409
MATSRGNRALAYLESKKNLAGSAAGVVGVGLTLAGVAGPYWPVVVAGLYGAAALIAPPEHVVVPDFPDPAEQLSTLRDDFATLKRYIAEVEPNPAAAGKLTELMNRYEALLDPTWVSDVLAADPEAVHTLSRAVRQDVPECVDTYHRARWWSRLNPGTESPDRHLEHQLTLLYDEADRLTTTLREAESRRQQTHTTYLEDRGRS